MADIRISELTKAYTLSGNDRIPISQVDPTNPSITNTLYMAPSALRAFVKDTLFPPGIIWPYAAKIENSAGLPTGWLLCDGSEVSINSYSALYAVIGTTYGATATPNITFKLPDMKCRFALGYNHKATTFTPAFGNFAGSPFTLGQTGGEFNHTLTLNELPSHTHEADIGPSYIDFLFYPSPGGVEQNQKGDMNDEIMSFTKKVEYGLTLQNTGGDGAHNNTPPYLAMHYIIKT